MKVKKIKKKNTIKKLKKKLRQIKNAHECWDYEENTKNMVRYDEALGVDQKYVSIKEIIVPSESDKEQLLLAFKYLHDNFTIDTDFLAVNSLIHIYLNPEKIKVQISDEGFPESLEKFETETYPRIWHLAYDAGVEAKNEGLPRICNLKESPFVTPSGNILIVYKSAWEQGWDGKITTIEDVLND